MLNKKGQFYEILLPFFTIIVFGTLFFLILKAPSAVDFSIGLQDYAIAKFPMQQEKFLIMMEPIVKEDAKDAINDILSVPFPTCERVAGYYIIKDNCKENLLEKINKKFNEIHVKKWRMLDSASLFTYLSEESFTEIDKKMQISSTLVDDDGKVMMGFELVPYESKILVIAKRPWRVVLNDYHGGGGGIIAKAENYPHFRIETVNLEQAVMGINELEKVKQECKKAKDDKLKDCAQTFAATLTNKKIIKAFSVKTADRKVLYEITVDGRSSTIDIGFEVPFEEKMVLESFTASYKGSAASAFALEGTDAIILSTKVKSQDKNIEIRWCLREKVDNPKAWKWEDCPSKYQIYKNQNFAPNTAGTFTSTHIEIKSSEITNPKSKILKKSELTIGVKSADETIFYNPPIFVSV